MSARTWSFALALLLPVFQAQAQTILLDETHTVVAPTAPSVVLRKFEVLTAGTYELTVTDLGVPGDLTDERIALLRNGAIVRELELGAAASATATFDATAGEYTLSIVATPGATGFGTVGALVRRGTDAPVLDVSETITAANPPPPANQQTLDATFNVTEAGDYRVSLADLGFPVALATAQLTLTREGGSPLVLLNAPGTATFSATAGTYRLFAYANANAAAGAGVLSVAVRSITDVPVYRRTVKVGRVTELGGALLAAGAHTLAGADLEIPAPLAAFRLAVTSEGQLVARLDTPGSVDFTALAAGHEILAAARPAAGASGSYTAELRRPAGAPLNYVNTVSEAANVGATTLPGVVATAGAYRLRLTDFVFPQGFTALRANVAQGGASVASLAAPGTVDVNLQTGPVNVLVFGQANTSSHGIYGLELRTTTGTGAAIIEGTRGVGTAFAGWQFNVVSAGRYQVIADDLEFPERFAGLDAVITRGPDVVGSFFGGGSFIFNATPGSYFINFIARPGATSGGAGTYRMRVATAPALPTVTLTATPAQVSVGGTTRIDWAATNATACTASGAWTGAKATSGNETTAALSTQSTFNLECTGPGGASNAQLVVNVSAAGSGGGGGKGKGGGSLSETLLLALLAAATLRAFSARAPRICRR